MEISRDLLLILHFIAMAGLLGGLLASQSKLNKGVLHSALLALVTGLGLFLLEVGGAFCELSFSY